MGNEFEIVLTVLIGIGLSATCGFRVFVPFLIMSIASLAGYLDMGSGFQWVGTYPALIAFSVATVLEILAYFFPYVDNLLVTVSAPIGVLAGVLVSAAVITDVNPVLQWSLAIIAGGGAATATTVVSNTIHHGSTAITGGVANPVVSAVESAGSMIMSVLAVLAPIIAVVLIIIGMIIVYKLFIKVKDKVSRTKEGYA